MAVKETFGVFRLFDWAGDSTAPAFGAPAGRRPGAKNKKEKKKRKERYYSDSSTSSDEEVSIKWLEKTKETVERERQRDQGINEKFLLLTANF